MPVGLRSRVPAKMTSCMCTPRSESRRLFAQHPGDGVGNIRFAASVGADDGGDAFALKAQFGAITKRLESEDLQLLQFEQLRTPSR